MPCSCDAGVTSTIASSYQHALPAFASTLQAFMAAQCALVGDHLWPDDALNHVLEDPNYDFIVVGAGSAGAVVANRLSEVPDWKVLLIEAGGNPTLNTEIPQIYINNIGSPIDWGYKNVPDERYCRAYTTKSCAWPRAKVLGGCSSVNYLYYVRGNRADYDEWAEKGNKGWAYEDVLPYFKKSENFSEPLKEDYKKYHNQGGYLSVESKDDAHELEKILIKAITQTGVKYNYDINGGNQMGVSKIPSTTKDGIRHSTARAFLSPIKNRKNFHVLKNSHVTKVLFKHNTNVVSGVMLHKDGKDIVINAKKEVVVSAGAINTPQLLMLSGIGPKYHLEKIGIPVKADLPVGESLQDHLHVPLFYTLPGDRNLTSLPTITEMFAKYMLNRDGPLASISPHRLSTFINTTDPKSSKSDIQFHYFFLRPNTVDFLDIYDKHGLSEEFQNKFQEINDKNFVLITTAILLKPLSTGKILLKNKNPFEKPLIYANYFEHDEDMKILVKSLKQHGLKLDKTEAFVKAGFKHRWLDLEGCKEYDKNTDEFLRCWSRETTASLYHPTSTAKMGPDDDETAVVNSELQVKKVEKLRVIDASIMPTALRGNTNAPTIMIGEKGADLIKKFWLNIHTEL